MKKLDLWLSKEFGRAAALAAYLNVSRSTVTQVRNGDRAMPAGWFERVEKFTRGALTVDEMARESGRLRNARRAA
jgi:DNA-binding transcriptional regulator YdaS (Cro superfamily)